MGYKATRKTRAAETRLTHNINTLPQKTQIRLMEINCNWSHGWRRPHTHPPSHGALKQARGVEKGRWVDEKDKRDGWMEIWRVKIRWEVKLKELQTCPQTLVTSIKLIPKVKRSEREGSMERYRKAKGSQWFTWVSRHGSGQEMKQQDVVRTERALF